ncbi:hypothetical protein VNO80_33966 [Phaseolus coccineus]|uniref:Uncharacterized protein n=1 Tax=Phaseolus coccineus TaxID=3886 RepID=A0AAN9Q8N8_PHACN
MAFSDLIGARFFKLRPTYTRSPLAVVLTLWLRKSPGSRFMDGFSQRKSLKLNQYQQHVVTGRDRGRPSPVCRPIRSLRLTSQLGGLVWLFLSIEKKESAVCASHLLLGSAGRHGILV